MSLIKIEHLSFSYYGYLNAVFDDVSFSFDSRWRSGLIGSNGRGKSTLFKLLLGQENYQGIIDKSVNCIKFPPNIADDTLSSIELFYNNMPNCEEWQFFKELNLLNIDIELVYRPFNTLSKGEQTKILLAMLFTNEYDFLLIDEPTNHLDFEGRQIVSQYLKNKQGFMLISHDRHFLDSCIDHVIAINRHSIDVQAGNFSSWYANKLKKEQFELEENKRLKKDIKRLKTAAQQSKQWSDEVEKSKIGTKISGAKPDKGRIGHLAAKMMKKSKNLERRQNRAIEEKQQLLKDLETKETLKLQILKCPKDTLIRVNNLVANYDERELLNHLTLEVKQGERIAVCGANGCGKTTLLKILLGQHSQYTGELISTNDLKISYIPQDTSTLTGHLTTYIQAQEVDETLCKTILRKLGFSRALFDTDMSHYSDGQKKKVLIAISLAQPSHLFIWDEPLNYIDIISRIQIEEILLHANATIIFVEHDKQFANNIATTTIEL